MKIKKAIIPAAGLGTRFLPATKTQPKEMLPIVDKPAIQYIVEEAVYSGIEEILIITSRNKQGIEDHFDRSPELEMALEQKKDFDLLKEVQDIANLTDIYYVRQKETKGLGHAIYCAKNFVGQEPFAVLLGDDIVVSQEPCLRQMIKIYDKFKGNIIAIKSVPAEQISSYGIVKSQLISPRLHRIIDLVEKPTIENAPSNYAIMGRYIIQPDIFDIIATLSPGRNGEIQLTDALKFLLAKEPIMGYEFQGKRYDVGNKVGFLIANIEFALARKDLSDDLTSYLKELIIKLPAQKN